MKLAGTVSCWLNVSWVLPHISLRRAQAILVIVHLWFAQLTSPLVLIAVVNVASLP